MNSEVNDYLFKIPVEACFEDQVKLTQFIYENGYNAPTSDESAVWKAFRFRALDSSRLEKNYLEEFKKNGLQSCEYWSRHRTDLQWRWEDTPVMSIFRKYEALLKPYFHKLTRVTAVVQKPNTLIYLHKDLVPGTRYANTLFKPFQSSIFTENDFHKNNKYLSLKMPLTTVLGDNGFPVVNINDQLLRYNVCKNFFLINEQEIYHGALKSDFLRGTIFFDGQLNVEKIMSDRIPVDMFPVKAMINLPKLDRI